MQSLFFLIVLGFMFLTCEGSCYPNIVFIIADDLGWNDVSFHGSDEIPTPNIDLLAYSGVALGRYYSHATCTPTRSALLTGKYSHITGMQGPPLSMSEDRGLPVNITILPQYLQSAGYKTHLVGKWHVGGSRSQYLPTNRGFDSHFGYRGGFADYYEYTLESTFGSEKLAGFTLFDDLTPAWDVEGYLTDVFNDKAISVIENHDPSSPLFLMVAHTAPHAADDSSPLQAPQEEVQKMQHFVLPQRRRVAAMVKKLDDSVGDIVQSLRDNGLIDNTIIVFVSDNGAMTTGYLANSGSNYPLRGIKYTPFEGGVRVAGLIWSANLRNNNNYWDGYMHVSDWLPTLLGAAGLEVPTDINGHNQWDNINTDSKSSRTVMYEIDDYTGYAAITSGDYKLITGYVEKDYSDYQGDDFLGLIGVPPSYTEAITSCKMYEILDSLDIQFNVLVRDNLTLNCNTNVTSTCLPDDDTVCLYNIITDPCETTDLSKSMPELVVTMQAQLDIEAAKVIARQTIVKDNRSSPKLHNYTWVPWIES